MMSDKTPEQIAAEKAAKEQEKAAKAQQKAAEKQAAEQKKAAEKAAKEEAKAKAKAQKEEEAAAKKAAAEQAKIEAKAKREQEKAAKLEAKKKAAEEAKAAKEAARMPEQNGIRRPKPDTLCGKAWAIFDEVSRKNGSPASIGESLNIGREQGLNEANVRAEYARWRKFFGITGRIDAPKAEQPAA